MDKKPNHTKLFIYFAFLVVGCSHLAQAFQSEAQSGLSIETIIHSAFTLIIIMGGIILKKLDTEITRNRNSASELFGQVSDLKLDTAINYSSKDEIQQIHSDIKDRFDKLELKIDSILTR